MSTYNALRRIVATTRSYTAFAAVRRKHSFPVPHRASQIPHHRHRAFWSLTKAFSDPNPAAAESESIILELSDPSPTDPIVIKATELAKKAASEDSPRGKTLLASLHREGLVVEKDYDIALRLFEEAAEAGDPIAQCSLGDLKLTLLQQDDEDARISPADLRVAVDERGENVAASVDFVKADGTAVTDHTTPAQLVRRVRKARRKAGFSDMQAKEFEQHREETEEEARVAERREAHQWLERAVGQDSDEAMMILANNILKEEPRRAVELYERAAKLARCTDAYYNLGQVYERGVGEVRADSKASLKNFSMAAQLGDASAQLYLAHLYRMGTFDVKVNEKVALRYVKMAANQEHAGAQYYLALLHRTGECGLEASEDEFHRLLEKAGEANHGPALACLGDVYYKGTDGVDVDYALALDYFTRAGRLGVSDALCSAAAMHFRGLGTDVDQHQAFMMYQEAALDDNVPALRNIASMHFYGHGVPCNKKMAEQFMKVADETEKRKRDELLQNADQTIQTMAAPVDNMRGRPLPNQQ